MMHCTPTENSRQSEHCQWTTSFIAHLLKRFWQFSFGVFLGAVPSAIPRASILRRTLGRGCSIPGSICCLHHQVRVNTDYAGCSLEQGL